MKPVFIAASPNTQFDDLILAFNTLISPWSWFNKNKVTRLEEKISKYHNGFGAVAFDSARTSLYFLLQAYGIGEGDEVLLPAFTCLVVANPVLWAGAKPVYVDNGSDFNIDLADLKRKVTPKTKAILLQHTFGKPVAIEQVRQIVGENVKIIEDTAHSLGGEYKGRKIGTLGDAAILTFGIEKMVSSVRGGMALTDDLEVTEKLRIFQQDSKRFSRRRILVSLLNPIFWKLITPVYYLGFGKLTLGRIFAGVAHMFSLLGNMIEKSEYKAVKPKWFPAQLPGALAVLASHQFDKLAGFNEHRRNIAFIYQRKLDLKFDSHEYKHVYLRFPVLVAEREKLMRRAKKMHVVLGDWYKNILYSPPENLHYFGYKKGSCKLAESQAREIVNLPTGVNVTPVQAEKISDLVLEHINANTRTDR